MIGRFKGITCLILDYWHLPSMLKNSFGDLFGLASNKPALISQRMRNHRAQHEFWREKAFIFCYR